MRGVWGLRNAADGLHQERGCGVFGHGGQPGKKPGRAARAAGGKDRERGKVRRFYPPGHLCEPVQDLPVHFRHLAARRGGRAGRAGGF